MLGTVQSETMHKMFSQSVAGIDIKSSITIQSAMERGKNAKFMASINKINSPIYIKRGRTKEKEPLDDLDAMMINVRALALEKHPQLSRELILPLRSLRIDLDQMKAWTFDEM